MFEMMDYRMQQQLAHELYRQQIMQRIPDPFPSTVLHFPMPQQLFAPRCAELTGVEAKLENSALWQEFHKIGTEMIITKTGRRIFPSMRLSLAGLEAESNYCVLLEMVPIGDCRYKFSGSQWVPAGGAEPQSPQRMYLHPDSPASGSHWQAQPILFSKVKLTNNTLDSNGHTVLASMHKYQPRIHVIRTAELTQIPWAPQQAFVFPETEFVAVTAYQNDRITKLKIDNNPFAKGFRESGQSRCKRKFHTAQLLDEDPNDASNATSSDDEHSSVCGQELPRIKRLRAIGSHNATATASESATASCHSVASTVCNLSQPPLMASAIIAPNTQPIHEINCGISVAAFTHLHYAHAQHCIDAAAAAASAPAWYGGADASEIDYSRHTLQAVPFLAHSALLAESASGGGGGDDDDDDDKTTQLAAFEAAEDDFVDVVSTSAAMDGMEECGPTMIALKHQHSHKHSFSISAILGGRKTVAV